MQTLAVHGEQKHCNDAAPNKPSETLYWSARKTRVLSCIINMVYVVWYSPLILIEYGLGSVQAIKHLDKLGIDSSDLLSRKGQVLIELGDLVIPSLPT